MTQPDLWPDPWPEDRPAPEGHHLVISPDASCPWCGVKPGERCWSQDLDWHGGYLRAPAGSGHLARVKPVPLPQGEPTP